MVIIRLFLLKVTIKFKMLGIEPKEMTFGKLPLGVLIN